MTTYHLAISRIPPPGRSGTSEHRRHGGRLTCTCVRRAGPIPGTALLFRDYLRHTPAAAAAYAEVKVALSELHPNDVDAYYAVKDPVCDLVVEAAEQWASSAAWSP